MYNLTGNLQLRWKAIIHQEEKQKQTKEEGVKKQEELPSRSGNKLVWFAFREECQIEKEFCHVLQSERGCTSGDLV